MMNIVALGIDRKSKYCCIIKSNASYEMLKENFDLYKVQYDQTNWSGCDELNRTIRKLNERLKDEYHFVLTGEHFKYNGENSGYDDDCGHSYGYCFEFDEVWEIKIKEKLQKNV